MKTDLLPVSPLNHRSERPGLPRTERAFLADWTDFAVLSFSVPPELLAPEVPFALDLFRGEAWVSLVWFNLRRLRFAAAENATELLCRPWSDHPFLNVRTYVRGPNGPGICFLAEWIPNRLSVAVGPPTYGLPYRHGYFSVERRPGNGTRHLRIVDRRHHDAFELTAPLHDDGGEACEPGSVDEFLLERYQAYTFGGRARKRFCVAHAPWMARRADWIRCELGFLRHVYPWFDRATFCCAHLCPGFTAVEMGRPHVVAVESRQEEGGRHAP